MAPNPITILDGGTGRELMRMGAPFRQPEWSALALMEGPQFVTRVHQAFIEAGADAITTNSYAIVPFHIGAERFQQRGLRVMPPQRLVDGCKWPGPCHPSAVPTAPNGLTQHSRARFSRRW